MAPTSINASSVSLSASGSRTRPQARRKPNDDAAYFGVGTVLGAKRTAPERADADVRVKRKRLDTSSGAAGTRKSDRDRDRERERAGTDIEVKASLVNFTSIPISALHRYLTQFDLVPPIYPSPLSAADPPPPYSLESPPPHAPSPPPTTPANRPRRESKEQSRRRSSRLLEEETLSRTPVLTDVDEVHGVLAAIAERHFREHSIVSGREEVDILASFMCKVKSNAGRG